MASDQHAALEKATGIAWSQWLTYLEPFRELAHREMAQKVLRHISEVGTCASPEWWAQSVTVAYERHMGRREPGQQCDQSYSVSVSRTFKGTMDEVLALWIRWHVAITQHQGLELSDVRTSETEKWRYWRAALSDGSKLNVNVQDKKAGETASLSLNHDQLDSREASEQWRAYWKAFIDGKRQASTDA